MFLFPYMWPFTLLLGQWYHVLFSFSFLVWRPWSGVKRTWLSFTDIFIPFFSQPIRQLPMGTIDLSFQRALPLRWLDSQQPEERPAFMTAARSDNEDYHTGHFSHVFFCVSVVVARPLVVLSFSRKSSLCPCLLMAFIYNHRSGFLHTSSLSAYARATAAEILACLLSLFRPCSAHFASSLLWCRADATCQSPSHHLWWRGFMTKCIFNSC